MNLDRTLAANSCTGSPHPKKTPTTPRSKSAYGPPPTSSARRSAKCEVRVPKSSQFVIRHSPVPASLDYDAFGRIYEYFLGEFAMSEGQGRGECYTPSSIVRLLTDNALVMPTDAATFEELPKVDWNAVRTWRWGGKWLLADPDIKRRKQAEFLVHERVPFELIEWVGVMNQAVAGKVAEILREAGLNMRVTVQLEWYHNV